MNMHNRKTSLLTSIGMTAYLLLHTPAAFSHSTGEHSGGFLQQLMHIVQSADHLFTVLALGVVVSLLVRQFKNRRRQVTVRRQRK